MLLKNLNIPANCIIVLHIRLKDLEIKLELNKKNRTILYQELSSSIISLIKNLFCPKTIIIPTFTYCFTKTGIYNRLETISEVGRFGEEIRLMYKENRTCDPIFSVIDIDNYLKEMQSI